MGSTLKGYAGNGTFSHGIHPPERKDFSSDAAIEVIPPPEKVVIPLLQNAGAPCAPLVKPKQEVSFGDLIGRGEGFISANIHTPISGKAQRIVMTTLPNGRRVKAIPVNAEGDQLSGQALWDDILGGEWPKEGLEKYNPQEITEAIHDAGIVGLGGAAFPTHVKLMLNEKKPVDTLLINGSECEPYLTSDYRLMLDAPNPVITGALLAGRATEAKDIIVGIEDNKPRAVEMLSKAASGTGVRIAVVKTKYPQGGEKNLIWAILKREVPLGGLPMDVGAAVSNVGTAAAIARAVIRKGPLTHRVVCVTGAGVVNPKNLLVPIGISFGELIEYCGGLKEESARLIAGGPMMGFSFSNLGMVVTKGTSGLTILTQQDIREGEETACIRCGQCVDACSMRLVPTKLAHAAKHQDLDLTEKYHIMGCYECGCCTYVCPANIPLIQLIRMGKAMVVESKQN
jgi:electron transport complex protein RnfC